MKLTALFASLALSIQLAAAETATNWVTQGETLANKGQSLEALKAYQEADQLTPNNADILCSIAKCYCDAMPTSKDPAVVKGYAQKALASAMLSLKADPNSPKSHCCVAVCYAKQFPYSDNQTKVDYSRQIKAEAEKAIELDPKFDLAYHMLGRWNFEVSNMGFLTRGLIRIAYGGLPKASKDAAIESFKQAIAIAPNRIIHHLQLAHRTHPGGHGRQRRPRHRPQNIER
jgi:tetratricopeptide (TPR) repeat protein